MNIAVTGHRPNKVHRSDFYSEANRQKLIAYAEHCLKFLKRTHQDITMITGMALGWDIAIAEACDKLEIPFIAAVPFKGQELIWRDHGTQVRYQYLLSVATKVVVVHEGPVDQNMISTYMNLRNRWMVDHCDKLVLALYDGTRGGTANCVQYAQSTGCEIIGAWASWTKFRAY